MSFAHAAQRLVLRSWRDDDLDLWDCHLNVPEVARTVGGLQTREAIAAALERMRACEAGHGYCFWALERRDDGAFLGFCGLKRMTADGAPADLTDQPEIGWRLRPDAWGQGYAREAATATLDLAFGRFALDQVFAITLDWNDRSRGLMQRLGMMPQPALDFEMPVHGRHVTYRIGREAWTASA